MRRNWDATHALNVRKAARTMGSFLFGGRYRYAPVSPLYVYGRPQDIALQKARSNIHQRNHLRLWLSPSPMMARRSGWARSAATSGALHHPLAVSHNAQDRFRHR